MASSGKSACEPLHDKALSVVARVSPLFSFFFFIFSFVLFLFLGTGVFGLGASKISGTKESIWSRLDLQLSQADLSSDQDGSQNPTCPPHQLDTSPPSPKKSVLFRKISHTKPLNKCQQGQNPLCISYCTLSISRNPEFL